jgi:hypothetical protein
MIRGRIKLTEKEAEYLRAFVKKGRKERIFYVRFPMNSPIQDL